MEIARLQIAVDAARAKRELKQFSDTAKAATGTIKGLLGPLAAIGTIAGSLSKLVAVQRQFDVLNAGLQTATGSAAGAAKAFEALQDFAAKTPYSLDQAVEGFTKLVNLGLTPSEAALTSYGNTASALGKDLNQMIEAVADAATGEFERLKEFGIKSKSEGDKVSFTFQGVTTTIGKNAAEIERYLTSIGENQFAGAMEKRINTLDGALSNFGDTMDGLFREVSAAGVGSLIEEQVRTATAAMQELTDQVASGELQAELSAIAGKFDGFSSDISESLTIISGLFEDETGYWASLTDNNVKNMIDTFRNLPENVRALIQIMTVEIVSGFDQVKAYARSFNDGINAIFTNDTFAGVGARLETELNIARDARESSISSILEERDTAINSFDSQIKESKRLREEYDNREREDGDRLAKYKVGTESASTATEKLTSVQKDAIKEAKQLAKDQQQNVDVIADLAESLYQASLSADALAQLQAELRLNEYATPEQVASVKQLAQSLQDLENKKAEIEKNKENVQLLGQVDPIAAEQQNFAKELEDLRLLNEAKLLEDSRYLDLKGQAERAHAEQMRILQEENFRAQSYGNELLMASLDQLQQGATDAFVGILTGASNSQEAVQQLASAILNEAVGALVEMGIAQVKSIIMGQAAQTAATATSVAAGAATAAAWTPAAAAASIASFGGAAASGLAIMAAAIPAMIGLLSFEGGGFTGTGSRSGGMDGKGGFMAMVHPNETIIDHTKGGKSGGSGGGVTIPISVNVSATDGMSAADAQRQGSVIAKQIEAQMMQVIAREQRPGGMLA